MLRMPDLEKPENRENMPQSQTSQESSRRFSSDSLADQDDGPRKLRYAGSGTKDDPYIVDWDEPHDKENPKQWSKSRRTFLTLQLGLSTFCVTYCSSAYTGSLSYIMRDLHMGQEVGILGLSLYVFGFALGPMVWAPLCEIFGRRIIFFATYTPFTLFHLGGALAHNIPTLLITRFLAGAFGSSPLSNAGGIITDIWEPHERAVPQTLYGMAPLAGPVFGPIIGGFVSQSYLGWRWNFWIMLIFSAFNLGLACIDFPETYAPKLLERRAQKLQADSGGRVYYSSKFQKGEVVSISAILKRNMGRPFVFLVTEPIVTALAFYSAVIYSILYAFFSGFPLVFEEGHGFNPGQNGLAFIGVGVGSILGVMLTPIQAKSYHHHVSNSPGGQAQPEGRMILAKLAAIALPIGMFLFAWTTSPSIHWIVPILAGVPFGLAMIVLFVAISAYLMDTYTIYCASALAANVLLRSFMGATFPLFTPTMLRRIGLQWGNTVFAFLSLICTPLPFLFFKYGSRIRARSKWATSLDAQAGASERPQELPLAASAKSPA